MSSEVKNQRQTEHNRSISSSSSSSNSNSSSILLDYEEKPLNESIRLLLNDTEISDVYLESSDNVTIPALKCILSSRSIVFRQLFYGGFRESNASSISLGFDSIVLYSIVEYCYTDDISLRRSSNCDDSWCRNVIRLIIAADYFGFTKLIRKLQNLVLSKMYTYPILACPFLDEIDTIMGHNDDGSCYCEVFTDLKKRAFDVIRWNGGISLIPSTTTKNDNNYRGGALSLQPYTLEKVLNDDELCADEITLFQALKLWCSSGNGNDNSNNEGNNNTERQMIASKMTSYLHLEKIKPSVLCNTIALSNLVSSTQLLEAFKTQALLAEENKLVTDQMRYNGKVIVTGAGVSEINGEYFPCGLSDGVPKYQRKTSWEGQDTSFYIFRWETSYWYISIVPEYDPLNKDDTNIDFYKAPANTIGPIMIHHSKYPPTEWKTIHEMDDPPPSIITILHDGSTFNHDTCISSQLQSNVSSDSMDCGSSMKDNYNHQLQTTSVITSNLVSDDDDEEEDDLTNDSGLIV